MELVIFSASCVFGAVIWALRLEGRIDTSEARYNDLKELINTRFDDSGNRLDRIERSMNGFLHKE